MKPSKEAVDAAKKILMDDDDPSIGFFASVIQEIVVDPLEKRIAELEEDLRKQFEIHAEMARVLGERIDMLEKANAMFAYEWKKDHSHGEFQKEAGEVI
jgi:hypothetical protein